MSQKIKIIYNFKNRALNLSSSGVHQNNLVEKRNILKKNNEQ